MPPKKNKPPQTTLQTISQNPDNQQSFVLDSDRTKSMPLPQQQNNKNKQQIEMKKKSKEKPQSREKPAQQQIPKAPQPKQQQANNKGKKKKKNSQRPKIFVTSKGLEQDTKLLNEQAENSLKQMIKQLKQQNWTQSQIKVFKHIIEQTNKLTLDKITKNVKIVPNMYSESIVPVEIQLTEQAYKMNQINMDNLKLSHDRLRSEKTIDKPAKFSPQIPENVDIVFEDGSLMAADDYIREMSYNPQMDNAREKVRAFEEHCNITQKKFIETVEIHRGTVKDLEDELNGPNPIEKSVKKKSQFK